MGPIGRLEELISNAIEGAFEPRPAFGAAALYRAARRALLRNARDWFDRSLVPNYLEIRIDQHAYTAWRCLLPDLEWEIGKRLQAFARDQGLETAGSISVRIVAGEEIGADGVEVIPAFAEGDREYDFVGPLVTPLGWAFGGRRPLRRVVLRSHKGGEREREHLVFFANHLVIGSDPSADLSPPNDFHAAPAVLILGSALTVTRPPMWQWIRWFRRTSVTVLAGQRLRFARGCSGVVRFASRDGRVTSASIAADRWTLTLAPELLMIGRDSATSDLCLEDDAISASHAQLLIEGAALTIEDLGSTNGVVINGHRMPRAALLPGDHVTLGKTEVEVVG